MQKEIKNILNTLPTLLSDTFPIPGKFKTKLPHDIKELSHLLTNKRGERSLSYLTRPNFLSAYLHYFLPWNLYRLCLLLPTLDITLAPNDSITDLGCGPLTLASALWISRPELRKLLLEINCIDRSGPVLEAGKNFFNALVSNTANNNESCGKSAWKINLIKEDIDIRKFKKSAHQKRKPAALVCAVNMFNEIYDNISHNNKEGLRLMAEKAALYMNSEAAANASILTIEPGVPQSGKFISLLRDEFIKLNRLPSSPCTHTGHCPFNIKAAQNATGAIRGRNWIDTKKRWCHFAFEAYDAPKELHKLSAAAKLPKDRLVLSYLLVKEVLTETRRHGEHGGKKKSGGARIISDAFPLPDKLYGRYGCCERGLILVTGTREKIDDLNSLSHVPENRLIEFSANNQYDEKSGALKKGIK